MLIKMLRRGARMLGGQSFVEAAKATNSITMRMALSIAAAILTMCDASSAVASLGGTATTVEADRARMQASLHMTRKQSYTVHELHAPNQVVVREFVSPTGMVFGVAWQGPSRPDLQQLLGGFFEHFTQAAKAQKAQRPGRQLLVQEPGLVVQSGGHARAFYGRAYVPQMLPAGVQPEEIQ
jgi:hypothetical protein